MRAGSKRTVSPPAAVMRASIGRSDSTLVRNVRTASRESSGGPSIVIETSSGVAGPPRLTACRSASRSHSSTEADRSAHVVHDAGRVSALGPPGLAATCISDVSIRRAPDRVARSMTVQQFIIMPVQRHCPAQTNIHRTGSDQIWEQEVAGSNPASPTRSHTLTALRWLSFEREIRCEVLRPRAQHRRHSRRSGGIVGAGCRVGGRHRHGRGLRHRGCAWSDGVNCGARRARAASRSRGHGCA